MKLRVTFSIEGRRKEVAVEKGDTLADVLDREKVNRETGLLKLNGALAHPAKELSDGDVLEFVNIIYGG